MTRFHIPLAIAGLALAPVALQAQELRDISLALGTSTVNIGYPNDTLPITLGYWAEEGLDVELLPSGGTLQGIQQLIGGGAEFSEGNAAGYIQSVATNDLPLKILMTYGVTDWQFIVPEGSEITDASMLEGKKVGMISLATGGMPLLRSHLAESGVDPDDVEVVPVGFGASPVSALQSGEVDALLYWSSAVALFENIGLEMDTFAPDTWKTRPDYSIATTDRILEEEPELAVAFARGMAKALVFAIANPECARRLHWEYYPDTRSQGPDEATSMAWDDNILAAKLQSSIDAEALYGPVWGAVQPQYWDGLQDYLVETGQIDAPIPNEDFLVQIEGFHEQVMDFDHDAIVAEAMACEIE